MKLFNILFDGVAHLYFLSSPRRIQNQLNLLSTSTTKELEQHGSSHFYISDSKKVLAKVVADKFCKQKQPMKWFCRDYLEKRWLLQLDARKELQSLKILQRAGLRTPLCHGWGVSLNPGNPLGSVLLMEYIDTAERGGRYFDLLDDAAKFQFLDKLCDQVLALAQAGYIHRDFHYNNLLITEDESIIWIDAHVRSLPSKQSQQWPALAKTLTKNKLRGERYREYVTNRLHQLWHAP